MKNILFVLFVCSFVTANANDQIIKVPCNKISIVYVDFSILTFRQIQCDEFPCFSFDEDEVKTIVETKEKNIEKLVSYFNSLKQDKNISSIDVRMKMFLYGKGRLQTTICIGIGRASFNGKYYKLTQGFYTLMQSLGINVGIE